MEKSIYLNPMVKNYPCKGCKDRYIGCHDHCELFLEVKEENKKVAREEKKKQTAINQLNSMKHEFCKRVKKGSDKNGGLKVFSSRKKG